MAGYFPDNPRNMMNCINEKRGFVWVIIKTFTRIGKILTRSDEI